MKRFIIILAVLLTGCSSAKGADNSQLTIQPVELEEEEQQLLSMTGAEDYQFFELDGQLAEEDDLIISTPIYKNGKKVSGGMISSKVIQHEYQNSLFSFSLDHYTNMVTMGAPDGVGKGKFTPIKDYSIASFRNNIDEEITLKKGEKLYLAYWIQKKDNSIRTAQATPSKIPPHVKKADYAIVYTIELVEEGKEDKN